MTGGQYHSFSIRIISDENSFLQMCGKILINTCCPDWGEDKDQKDKLSIGDVHDVAVASINVLHKFK